MREQKVLVGFPSSVMNIAQIENNLQHIIQGFNKETFIYDLLLAYGLPKASISKLRIGSTNLSKTEGEILWRKKLLFKSVENDDLYEVIASIKDDVGNLRHEPRFILVTDFETLLAVDTKTADTLDILVSNLPRHYDFFLPWAGMEKAVHQNENPADVKAAERMAKLYDEINKDNPTKTPEEVHSLNVFLSRLLFCFFAEDTGIFKKSQFTHAISNHTQPDGSDLSSYLDTLFGVMNTSESQRSDLPDYLNSFPYVNGGLFRNSHSAPLFTRRSRQMLIESGDLDWSAINPDIFGSMIQAVITPEHRGGLGMHYTSVPNIMKVIEPLFLNELREEFDAGKNEPKRLNKLLERIGRLKIFDPACGSGNFLIIAYKELRSLEIEILLQLQKMQKAATGFEPYQLELIPKSQLTLAAQFQVQLFTRVQLSQFYGIELDDFAHEVAVLSLWLAQHQMNSRFKEVFGGATPTLPLRAGGNIIHGNATRINWDEACPKRDGDEIYILGNPPYLGSSMQSAEQKDDMRIVFLGNENYKKQDYISCWFYKAALYLVNNTAFSFVTTNSVCQGTQVEMTWPLIFDLGHEIFFAIKDFKWSNSAKSKAAVICSIIGVSPKSNRDKYLYINQIRKKVNNINAYLINGSNTIVTKRSSPLSLLPKMTSGNKPLDGGNLVLSTEEANELSLKSPDAKAFLKRFIGSFEYINGAERWCLWIPDKELSNAIKIPSIKERIDKVKSFRANGGNNAQNKTESSHRFEFTNEAIEHQLIIPRVSSVRRKYIPIGFVDKQDIIADSAQAIFDPDIYVFAILNSSMHMAWVHVTAGRLKSDFRYSSFYSYHTFPFPPISEGQKRELEKYVYRILEEREVYSEKNLAQLYDPDKMPAGLREVHRQNDLAVERCYRTKPFESDEERLEFLFKLYEQMIAAEKDNETLFEKEKKSKKIKQ